MKKILSILLLATFVCQTYAQKRAVRFLDIPVEGTRREMMRKLKAKGFKDDTTENCMVGTFSGREVLVILDEENVTHLKVVDNFGTTDKDAALRRFKELCRKYNNDQHITLKNKPIPDYEEIEYEMSVNRKKYAAWFAQIPTAKIDTNWVNKKILQELSKKCTPDQLKNPVEYAHSDYVDALQKYSNVYLLQNIVIINLFKIHEKFYIGWYFFNQYEYLEEKDAENFLEKYLLSFQ